MQNWFLSTDKQGVSPVVKGNEIYERLRLQYRKGQVTDPLEVVTEVGRLDQRRFTFYIQSHLYYTDPTQLKLNEHAIEVELSIGCFQEHLSTFFAVLPSHAYSAKIMTQSSNSMSLIFPKQPTDHVKVIDLKQVFKMESDWFQCGAVKVTSYTTENGIERLTHGSDSATLI